MAPLGSANHFNGLALAALVVSNIYPIKRVWTHARHAVAFPLYAVALTLDYLSTALGRLGAWIAGDDCGRGGANKKPRRAFARRGQASQS